MEESEIEISVNLQSQLTEKLNSLSMEESECTIYRVHRHLRSVSDKAYDPEVIAIGPYHRGNQNLKMLEEHKLRYLHLLLKHKHGNLEKYVSAIEPLEQKARKCYAEAISLSQIEFIDMLVLDGCFIIQLVRKCTMMNLREKNDPIFHMDWIMNSLQRDLMLFENQIPFFILLKLFDLIEVPNQHTRLFFLIFSFFSNVYPGKGYRDNSDRNPDEIKHLLDLVHGNWFSPSSLINIDEENTIKIWRFIDSATELVEANVEFEKADQISLFDVGFQNGIMSLVPLTIEDRTETFFRNLIAYEQYFQDFETNFVTDYAKFLDCLIDTSKDVEILSKCKIIDNWLGDDEAVADLFNKLTDLVTGPSKNFIYAEIFDRVNRHCSKPKNKNLAILRHKYFNSPWAITSVIVGLIVLILTFIQTVCSILQVS